MQKYLAEYNTFIKNAPWYYEMSRYFFKEQLFDFNAPKENQIGVCNVIFNMTERLIAFSNKQNFFLRWLLGLNSLISKGRELYNSAINERDAIIHDKQQNGTKGELTSISDAKITTNIKKEFSPEFDTYLTKKTEFIASIPKSRPPKLMPQVFARWRNNELAALPQVCAGRPMTYKNLILEKQATKKVQENAREKMIEKRREQIKRDSFFNLSYDVGQAESDRIDATEGVLSHVNIELKKLRDSALHVEICIEDSRPYISIPRTV